MSNDGHSPLPFVFTCVPYKFFCSRLAEIVLTGYHLCGKVGRVWVKRGESPLWVMSDLYQQHQPNEANSTSETWIDLQYCEWIWYILSASITIPRNFGWWQLSPFSISFIYIYIHHLTQRGKFGEAFRWTTMILPGHSEAWVISVQRTPDVLQFLCPTKCRPKKLDSLFTLCVVAASPQKDTCFWWAPDIRWCIFLSMHCVVTNFWIP